MIRGCVSKFSLFETKVCSFTFYFLFSLRLQIWSRNEIYKNLCVRRGKSVLAGAPRHSLESTVITSAAQTFLTSIETDYKMGYLNSESHEKHRTMLSIRYVRETVSDKMMS